MRIIFNIEESQSLILGIGEADLIDILIFSIDIEVLNLFKSLFEMISFLEGPGYDGQGHCWRQE
jgi:hypothetical protein